MPAPKPLVGPKGSVCPHCGHPLPIRIQGRTARAITMYAFHHDGLVDTCEVAAQLGLHKGTIRGALARLGAVKTETPRVYRLEVAE